MPKELRILVCGSRDWDDEATIRKELMRVIVECNVRQRDVLVITGGASGADEQVWNLCRNDLGIACARFDAPWGFMEQQGNKRAAGPIRNAWMLRWGQPNFVLAFHPYLPKSRGTKLMLKLAKDAGVIRRRLVSNPSRRRRAPVAGSDRPRSKQA